MEISIVGDRSFDPVPSEMAAGNGLLDRRALLGAGAAAVTAGLVGDPDPLTKVYLHYALDL